MMLIHRCIYLILGDILTQSCLHHFLLEFLGTAVFLTASLSAVLFLPPASGGRQLNLSKGNQGNQSHDQIMLGNLSNEITAVTRSNQSNLAVQGNPCSPCQMGAVSAPGRLQVALVFGLSVAMAAVCVGGGVHLNPAVTMAMALSLRLHLWRAALYVIGQLSGSVAAVALLMMLTEDVMPTLNQVSSGVKLHLAVAMETLVTFQLVLVVLATSKSNLPAEVSNLLVGLAVSLGHLIAVGVTGCGMNPARSFGPALVTLHFKHHWVFWAGPGLGACLAVLLNDFLLRPRWRLLRDWWAELKQHQMAPSQNP